ncbi:histone acetyltransferase MCC1 isoform X2 [Phragmites australis]|uniref:histone acetyltransferase MCC1 isoform X2 n=1 Tax=Phragmites australis TaxID=29695 RepID=UPI002D766059|nr:histone acetyltransferase MCC1 isoform X2 [Phragmites australis]
MLDPRSEIYPTIEYRPIQPSDLEALEKIHLALFPIRFLVLAIIISLTSKFLETIASYAPCSCLYRYGVVHMYEREFFMNVVNGHGTVSWGAVDTSRSDDHRDEIIGFVTTRMIVAKDSEIEDLFRYNSSRKDLTLVYILTLGVVDSYRNLGIASSLVREVIKYAASISNCRGVYLHVISYNQPAISFYKKMLFKLVRRLPLFYYIRGQHYDSYLFVYYVNAGCSPCSPLAFLKMLVAKFWTKEDHCNPRWDRCKETTTLLTPQNDKRIISGDDTRCHV